MLRSSCFGLVQHASGWQVSGVGDGEPVISDRAAEAFISYSHVDREFALGLRDELRRRGKSAWVDEQEIRPAALWADDVGRAIEGADSYVFVISSASVASRHCLEELKYADSLHKRILPVNYRAVPESGIPSPLSARQRARFAESLRGLIAGERNTP